MAERVSEERAREGSVVVGRRRRRGKSSARSSVELPPQRRGDSAASSRRGIFCLSDLIAYGAHRRLTEAGLLVPRDVVLVGFDDNPLNDWVAPWLSSVRVPYDRFGPAVVAGLRKIALGHGVETVLEHHLVVRSG